MSASPYPSEFVEFVAAQESEVTRIRKSGDPAAIIAAAEHAADAIEARLGPAETGLTEDQRAGLAAEKRMLFNAAADCWPGWAVDAPKPTDADLIRALTLAQRSAKLVQTLKLGAKQEGTAIWLIGAFELALGRTMDALVSFVRAEFRYRDVPSRPMALLSQGYAAIACEAGGITLPTVVPDFDHTMEEIGEADFEDGISLTEQLSTARQVFVTA